LKKLKKIFDFYIESNIHVAIAAACFVLITQHHFDIEHIEFTSYFVFFSTVLGYQFIRIFDNCACNAKTLVNTLRKQSISILVLSSISLIGSIYFGLKVGLSYLGILIPSTIITIWYAVPFFRLSGSKTSLRNYPSIKMFSIALVWSINTVLFPLQNQLSEPQVWLEFTQRFLLFIVLIIPFDIRDMHKDTPMLQTLPQKVGALNSKKIGFLYLILFFLLNYFKGPIAVDSILSELFVFTIVLLFLVKASENQTKYYASFWVESVPMLWWFVLIFIGYYL